jgi:uncharacterized phiE125 gp8 family phage protein
MNNDDIYTVTTPASTDVFKLDEAKDFLRVDNTSDDSIIKGLIKATTIIGEKFTNRTFVQRTITALFQQFETSQFEEYPYVQIRRAPLVSITSVRSMIDGVWTDVPAADWQLKNSNGFPRLLFLDTVNTDDVPYPLQVILIAGYGAASVVPEDIQDALKMHISFLYENRGDVDTEGKLSMPRATRSIYNSYRILNTFG